MPLRSGSSQKTISSNIHEIMKDWEKDGTIGNGKPKSKQKAVKQAAAIAYDKARDSGERPVKKKAGTAKNKAAGTAKTTSANKKSAAKKTTGVKKKTAAPKKAAAKSSTGKSKSAARSSMRTTRKMPARKK